MFAYESGVPFGQGAEGGEQLVDVRVVAGRRYRVDLAGPGAVLVGVRRGGTGVTVAMVVRSLPVGRAGRFGCRFRCGVTADGFRQVSCHGSTPIPASRSPNGPMEAPETRSVETYT